MIVLAVATVAVLAGIGLAFFIDWGGHRRLAKRARHVARIHSFADTSSKPTLVEDLAGRVRELV